MPSAIYIVTGASRGLGAAIAEQLLAPGHTVLCISRKQNPALEPLAGKAGATLLQWQRDLADPERVAEELAQWLAGIGPAQLSTACLINNAAMISRVGPVDESSNTELAQAVRVGIEAPLLLSASFLRATRDWPASRRILNISSGLGRRAMAGSAAYCAVKAGLDNLSRAMALDETGHANAARIVSLAPGVIDTDMQVQLRGADEAGFPDKANFVALKERGMLASPAQAARQVVDFLHRAEFGNEVIADVRNV
ncbi:SDR family NAD(P)-dependent oxidoreductase [Piscinibacter sakaiensis]|uniref:SDR family NAD(P)-dependent oxidoreductase n=1 Tax=Piscinibacter sakaiensis TaxID=1547922 RepID=UPI003AAAF41C